MTPTDSFHVYDTTLRDGSQREGLSLSVNDKLAIARHLDDLGVGFIEGGWPGANPKDTEFFARAQSELQLKTAQLAAFGSTRRPGGVDRRTTWRTCATRARRSRRWWPRAMCGTSSGRCGPPVRRTWRWCATRSRT